MKGKAFKTVVPLALMYDLETGALSKKQEVELEVQLKMLIFALGVTSWIESGTI